ncbi:MAG TPA: TM0106 family RecB-like putative nuclease [Gaiellales bacterium]
MESRNGELRFSPSDLTEYLACAHASAQSRAAAKGERSKAYVGSQYANLIFAKGDQHEAAYLERLRAAGRGVVDVGRLGDFSVGAARTAQLMRAGVDVIYQGAFVVGAWRGLADFVERVDEPSGRFDWSYQVVDTKLARAHAAPSHVLQLCFYSEGVAQVQGSAPPLAHLELGSGLRETIRLREVAPYFRRSRAAFEEAARSDLPTAPYPCEHCGFCAFRRECDAWWLAEDHLTRVAWISRAQVELLTAGGVGTRGGLAALPREAKIADLRPATLANLHQQARLQVAADTAERVPYELLAPEPDRGFARLPDPSPGDVMFDLEGDPLWTPSRELTFLFGLLLAEGDGWRYEPVWAHSLDDERTAFRRVIDLIAARLEAHPDMHVYHYSPAEPGALQRLMADHATRELEVDDLLRRKVMVDLLTVVRQAMRVGVESYSLKRIEHLAGFRREADMGSGADAVLGYERWVDSHDDAELDGIARYNDEDCRATLALRDWLVSIRPPGVGRLEPIARKDIGADKVAEATAREALRLDLVTGADPGSVRWLAGELLEYHRREARPGWWRYFSLLDMDGEELIADAEAIGGLVPTGPPVPRPNKVFDVPLRFPPQQHKLEAGSLVDPDAEKAVTVSAIDNDACTAVVRAQRFATEPPPRALVPLGPIDNHMHREALTRLATAVRDSHDRYGALREVLAINPPRFVDRPPSAPIQTTDLAEQQALARGLDRSYLLVQGPPGTGKTYTGARLIVDLIERGHRVGVTALSHRAINKLLEELEHAADERGAHFRGARKAADHPAGRVPDGGRIENVEKNPACLDPEFRLVAGTTWLFAPEEFDETLDYLVIDEAGQLSLADALAAGTAAQNLILLGDPLQLPQVSQATHPQGTNASILQHLLGVDATVPEDRGVFLTETWRMHPDVCRFISDEVYEGRLSSHPSCALQTTSAGTGIRYLPVVHRGNGSQSPEEAERVRAQIAELVGTPMTDQQGRTRPLTTADIMVVSPYNAQVRLLRHRLPDGVRVGTVDAFQGQEAPVVIFSMATSSGEDVPRDIAFLFSRNRLNVAISRARSLAYLCCAPGLLEARARTVDEMRLISTLCSLVETAEYAA